MLIWDLMHFVVYTYSKNVAIDIVLFSFQGPRYEEPNQNWIWMFYKTEMKLKHPIVYTQDLKTKSHTGIYLTIYSYLYFSFKNINELQLFG